MRTLLLTTLCLLLPLPALADDWSDGLRAEHRQRDYDRAIKHYTKAQRSDSVHAKEATKRKIRLLVLQGETGKARKELSWLSTFPGEDGLVFWKKVLAETKGRRPGKAPSPWRKELERILTTRTVTLNFPDTPISEALSFVQDITGFNVVTFLDLEDETVTARVKNLRLDKALALVLAGAKLEYTLVNKVLLVHKKGKPPKLPRVSDANLGANPELFGKLCAKQVAMNFDQTPFVEAIEFMQDITGLIIVIPRDLRKRMGEVTFRVRKLDALDALELLAGSQGTTFHLSRGAVVFGPPPPKPAAPALAANPKLAKRLATRKVTLNFPDTPIAEVVSFLKDITGLDIRLGPGVDLSKTVSVRLRNIRLHNALQIISEQTGLRYRLTKGGMVILERVK